LGYVLSEVKIKNQAVINASGTNIHPILMYIGNSSDAVEGTIFSITTSELQQADDYEVDEYIRVSANFKSGQKAWAYVWAETNGINT